MPGTIQVESIDFYEPGSKEAEFADGAVWFLVLLPSDKAGDACKTHPGLKHRYERLPFHSTPKTPTPNGQTALWGWDGNRSAPTVHGSMGAFPVINGNSTGRDYNAHLHFTAGRIELCSDATVTVHPDPKPCVYVD